MKSTRSLVKNGSTLKLMIVAIGLAFGATEALAALPADPGDLLPDSIGGDTDGFSAFAYLSEMGLKLVLIAIGGLMCAGSAYKVYNTFADKKTNEDSSGFSSAIFMAVVLVAVGVGLLVAGFGYVDGMADLILT
jgi:hypothetical protein